MKTKNLKYNITISTAPTMPKLGKGTECVQLLLSQVSKDMHEPLVPMLFPSKRLRVYTLHNSKKAVTAD
jgi:hypothetical protein